jgi:resuscitation-promoting factor RpfB
MKISKKKLSPLKGFSRKHIRHAKRVSKMPWFVVPFATFFGLLAITAGIVLFLNNGSTTFKPTDASLVTITVNKTEQTVPTRAKNVGTLLERLNIELNEGDIVEPDATTEIVGDNFRVNVYRAVPVTIVDGDRKTFTYSAAATARSIVRRGGITVYPEDKLQLLPVTNFLTESSIGERVVIDRATPVSLNLYGTPVTVRTHLRTVGDLLKEKNVKIGKDDSVQPSQSTVLTAQTQIFLIRKGTQIITEEQPIAMPSETVEDASLSFGTTAVRQQGSPGKKVITYQVELQNGKEISRKQIQEVVAQEPVKQVIARGKAVSIPSDKQTVMAQAGVVASDYAYADYIISRESGWCPTKWQGQYGGCPSYYQDLHDPSSSYGYGLCQSTPAGKMASAGSDWQTNPVTQLRWCSDYAKRRHGGWAGAYSYWQANHNW